MELLPNGTTKELSALRGELTTTKGELDSLLSRYSRMWDAHDKCAERLTAAEQRNAELTEILYRFVELHKSDYEVRGGMPIRWQPLIDEADNALKPTESGAIV